MAVLLDKNTRLIVQGITGKEGTFHAKAAAAFYWAFINLIRAAFAVWERRLGRHDIVAAAPHAGVGGQAAAATSIGGAGSRTLNSRP